MCDDVRIKFSTDVVSFHFDYVYNLPNKEPSNPSLMLIITSVLSLLSDVRKTDIPR